MANCIQCGSYNADNRVKETGVCRKCGVAIVLGEAPPVNKNQKPLKMDNPNKPVKEKKASKGKKKADDKPGPEAMPYFDPIEDAFGTPPPPSTMGQMQHAQQQAVPDPQGMPPQNYGQNPQGMPPQNYGQDPQGVPPQNYEQNPQGMPPQNYEQNPQGMPPQNYEQNPQGMPPQNFAQSPYAQGQFQQTFQPNQGGIPPQSAPAHGVPPLEPIKGKRTQKQQKPPAPTGSGDLPPLLIPVVGSFVVGGIVGAMVMALIGGM